MGEGIEDTLITLGDDINQMELLLLQKTWNDFLYDIDHLEK